MKLVVGDASSLILLAKANILVDLLKFVEILIPTIVYQEILKGKEKNKQDAFYIEQLINANEIVVVDANEKIISQIRQIYRLDLGETHAIALAKEKNIDILIDDRAGIIVCNKLNIDIFTALLVLEELTIKKLIPIEKSKSALALFIQEGRYKKKEIDNLKVGGFYE